MANRSRSRWVLIAAVVLWTALILWNCSSGFTETHNQIPGGTETDTVVKSTVFLVNFMIYLCGLIVIGLVKAFLDRQSMREPPEQP
jgi:hypothetical protein